MPRSPVPAKRPLGPQSAKSLSDGVGEGLVVDIGLELYQCNAGIESVSKRCVETSVRLGINPWSVRPLLIAVKSLERRHHDHGPCRQICFPRDDPTQAFSLRARR